MAGNYDNIRDAISRVVAGCGNYNEKIRKQGGFYLPNPPREGRVENATGKAYFHTSQLETLVLEPGQLLLTTIRSHNQFNTTIYGVTDRYRGIEGSRRVVLMNQADIDELGLAQGDVVDLTSHFTDGERHAYKFIVVPYPIPRQCAAAYFPEANPLVPLRSVADKSLTPTSKSIVITIQPSSATV